MHSDGRIVKFLSSKWDTCLRKEFESGVAHKMVHILKINIYGDFFYLIHFSNINNIVLMTNQLLDKSKNKLRIIIFTHDRLGNIIV